MKKSDQSEHQSPLTRQVPSNEIPATDVSSRQIKEQELQLSILSLVNRLHTVSDQQDQLQTLLQTAEAINQAVPIDMLVSNTFFHNLHFLSSCFEVSKYEGGFRPLPTQDSFHTRRAFDLHRLTNGQPPMNELLSKPGVYGGEAFEAISQKYPNPKLAWETYGIRAVMYVPLTIVGQNVGSVVLASRNPAAFTEADLRLMQTVFSHITLAIQNVLAYEEMHQREKENTLRLALNNTLINLQNPAQLTRTLASELNRIVPFTAFHLRIYQPESEQVYYRTYLYRDQPTSDETGAFSEMLPYLLVQSQFRLYELETTLPRSTTSSGIYEGESYRQFVAQYTLYQFVSKLYGFQSLVFLHIPLKQGNCACLVLWSAELTTFKNYHYDLINSLIPQISLALDNLLSFDKIRRRDEQSALQLTLSNALLTQQPPAVVLPQIAGAIGRHLPCDSCYLASVSTDLSFNITGWGAVRADEEFVAYAKDDFIRQAGLSPDEFASHMRTEETIMSQSGYYVGERFDELVLRHPLVKAAVDQSELKSLMYLPLNLREGHIVTLIIGSRKAYAYAVGDLELMQDVATQMAHTLGYRLAREEIERLKGQLEAEKAYLQDELTVSYNFGEIIGQSQALKTVFEQVRLVAATDSTVLVEGETGTGKELIARAIHEYSLRKDGILVKINCAALPAQLIESELFGHEKGSFTGAYDRRIGKFELANGGTLFLDEVGELPLELQAKLLRAIQEREIERLGGRSPIRIDVRIIAATNKNLAQESSAGRFRPDLYYRLNVFPIHLPPLRERRDDIPLLAVHFTQRFARRMGKKIGGISAAALQQLMRYEYPGNIRELEHIIEHSVILTQGHNLELGKSLLNEASVMAVAGDGPFVIKSLQNQERDYILQILKYTSGRIRGAGGAAELLQIHPNTLESRMQKLGIRKEFTV